MSGRVFIKSITGVNFVDLGTRPTATLHICNTYTKEIKANVVVGQDDIAGSSSIGANDGAFLVKEIRIPVGITLVLRDLFLQSVYTDSDSSTKVDDATLLVSLDSSSSTADITIFS